MIKLSDYVFDFIAGQGVRHVFLLPGGGCMHLVDSLGKHPTLTHSACLHEQAAAICADAYAQYSGGLGVALVTTGPGATNAITGVAGSWIDSVPVLVISGQAKRADLMGDSGVRQIGIQEVDIVSVVRPITKLARTVLDPQSIRRDLEEAVFRATSGRPGPVWIDIPLDVQGATIDEAQLEGFDPPERPADPATAELAAQRAWTMIQQARRPVILAGNGIRLAGALEQFLQLVEQLRVPVLTTWRAADFLPDDHPCFFGRPGAIAQRGANFVQQNADLLLVVGARLDLAQVGFNYPGLAPRARKIVVDVDPAELGKIKTPVDLPACLDATQFTEHLRRLVGNESCERPDWLSRCRRFRADYPVTLPGYRDQKDHVNTYVLVDALSDLLAADDVIVPGSSGSCAEITMQAFKVKRGQRIFNSPGLGAMGFGLPACIGACIASGRRRTISIIGDGGLQHNIQELETIRRLALPLKIFILNNFGYASIRTMQKNHFEGRLVCCDPTSRLTLPDTCRIARAYGITATRLESHEGLGQRLAEILALDGPVICDVKVDPDLLTAPRLSSEVRPDGSIVSRPLEDLWPFLDREELARNMEPDTED